MSEDMREKEIMDDDTEYEKICFICRRPESKTGKQVILCCAGGVLQDSLRQRPVCCSFSQ